MPTKTKIWTTQIGRKIPLPMMDDDHLKNTYKYLLTVSFDDDMLIEGRIDGKLTVEQAKEWIPIITDELKRRKIALPKVDRHTYQRERQRKSALRKLKLESNKAFDEKFKHK